MTTHNEPKFEIGHYVNGKRYGRFAITGREFSAVVGEWIYGVIEVDADGRKVSSEMRLVESCFA